MTHIPPRRHRVSSQSVTDLAARIRAVQRELQERADEAIAAAHGRARDNLWMDVAEFLGAFPRLTLVPGAQLVCVYTPSSHERTSRLVVRVGDDIAPPPAEPPASLRALDMPVFFGQDELPDEEPGISWNVLRYVRDDGSPDSLFEKSIFSRWITELLNFGHGVYWPRHRVIADAADVHAHRESPWRVADGKRWPDDWRPLVICEATLDAPDVPRPESADGLRALEGCRFDVVEFYSTSVYVSESLTRYADWYLDRALRGSEHTVIAEGGAGYLV